MEGIGIHDPYLDGAELAELEAVIQSNWLSAQGEKVAEFEKLFASFLGVPGALAAVNGSAALILALRASGVGPGDHVLVSDYGFIATADAVRHVGAEPIFLGPALELEPYVSLELLSRFFAEEVEQDQRYRRTGRPIKGFLYNEPYGFHCPHLKEIHATLEQRGLFLIEDSSQALGVKLGDAYLGTIGHLGVFSFNGNKTLAVGSAGALVGGDSNRLSFAAHLQRHARSDSFDFFFDDLGYNFQCSNLSAAVAVAQARKLGDILAQKARLRRNYARLLSSTNWRMVGPQNEFPAWLNVILCKRRLDRDEWRRFAEAMDAKGIRVRPVFPAVTRNKTYIDGFRFGELNADEFFARGICLPSGPRMDTAAAERVVEALSVEGARIGIA